MSEHQVDYNSDFHNSDLAGEQQHLSLDLTGDYHQDTLTNSIDSEQSLEQPWEQPNQTEYTQSDFNPAGDYYSSGYDEVEGQSDFSDSDSSALNNTYNTIQSDSLCYEQSTYSLEQKSFENVLDTQDYDKNLWEQQYHNQGTSFYSASTSFTPQRSGHEPTAQDLEKANELDAQAHEAEQHYEDETSWADHLKNENHPDAHVYYEKAAEYRKKQEDLEAQAAKLRGE